MRAAAAQKLAASLSRLFAEARRVEVVLVPGGRVAPKTVSDALASYLQNELCFALRHCITTDRNGSASAMKARWSGHAWHDACHCRRRCARPGLGH